MADFLGHDGWSWDDLSFVLDTTQAALDAVGVIPGLGEVADGLNGLISLGRRDYVGAGLSFVSMVPIFGDIVGKGGKITRYAVEYSDEAAVAMKELDNGASRIWSQTVVAPSRVFATGASSHGEKLIAGGIEAAQSFDPMLSRLFKEANAGEFQGIWKNRQAAFTQFDDAHLAIYFRRDADITGRVVGEEVQHAVDFTMGATRSRISAEAAARGIADADVVQWWHRRVFTRQLQNIHADQYGMGVLKPYADDVYRAYQQQGGRLTLDEILSRTFNGLY